MRILFAFAGGAGHAEPLVPLARAAVRAGNAVAFCGRPDVVETIAERGFDVFPTGSRPRAERLPLRPVDRAHEGDVLRDWFAGRLARERAGAVRDVARGWRPDVLVCDEVDFGSMAAAERL